MREERRNECHTIYGKR